MCEIHDNEFSEINPIFKEKTKQFFEGMSEISTTHNGVAFERVGGNDKIISNKEKGKEGRRVPACGSFCYVRVRGGVCCCGCNSGV